MMTSDPSEPMLKIVGTGAVAAMLGVTQRAVRNLAVQGRIPSALRLTSAKTRYVFSCTRSKSAHYCYSGRGTCRPARSK